jgi:hypothetical protein
MEKIVEQSLLFDFYGELLTSHQQSIYQDAVFQDMSLSEIAENYGISRQGVHDLLKRCDKIMQEYEDSLHLIAKFSSLRTKMTKIQQLADSIDNVSLQENKKQIQQLTAEILEEL